MEYTQGAGRIVEYEQSAVRRGGTSADLRLAQAALAGGAIGGLCGSWLVVLQNASAWAAGMFWTISTPWLNLPLYAVIGVGAGALAGPALELVRRGVARRYPGWAWIAGWLGLGAYGAMTIGLAGRGAVLGSRLTSVLIVQTGVLLALAALALALLRRHPATRMRQAVVDATSLMLATLSPQYMIHVLLVGDPARRGALDLAGWHVVGAMAAAGLIGVLLGVQLRDRRSGRSRKAARWVRGAALAVLVAIGAAGLWAQAPPRPQPATEPSAEGPNVLLVVLDTLRRDAVSAYGAVEGTTPNLDAFAAEGVLWEDAIVPANWTVPGHASLFTGAQVTRHGSGELSFVLRNQPGGPNSLPLPTIAEAFDSRGWRTVAFACNPYLNSAYGFDRGFGEYYEAWRARKGHYDLLTRALGRRLAIGALDRGGRGAVRGLAAWLASNRDTGRPWFAFVNMAEPHAPYDVPDPWLNRFLDPPLERWKATQLGAEWTQRYKWGGAPAEVTELLWPLYLGAVAYQDELVGLLLAVLAESGTERSTIVVITSDHGENFGWQGQLNHAVALNDDLIRIPLMARGPGIPVGVRDGSPVSVIDVFPTLLHLAGLPPLPADPGRPGRVLPPIGPPVEGDRPRVAERYAHSARVARRARALRDAEEPTAIQPGLEHGWEVELSALLVGPWRAASPDAPYDGPLTRRVGEPLPPDMDGSIVVDDAERLERMLRSLSGLRSSWPRALDAGPAGKPELDAETTRSLKALGYIDE